MLRSRRLSGSPRGRWTCLAALRVALLLAAGALVALSAYTTYWRPRHRREVKLHIHVACDREAQTEGTTTRADLLLVIPCNLERLALARASRAWRAGVPTAFIMDKELALLAAPHRVREDLVAHLEHWASYPDIVPKNKTRDKPGDLRATIAPFLANQTVGVDTYRWILYGDDDTFFFIDNVLKLVNKFDHDMPYILTDNIWMLNKSQDSGGPHLLQAEDVAVHPNRAAPRCLPCGYSDPLDHQRTTWDHQRDGFLADPACPCTQASLCAADTTGIMFDRNKWLGEPRVCIHKDHVPSPGYWYFLHGGAGALISRGLMRLTSYERCERFARVDVPKMSGDAMFTLTVWHMMGVGITDPGYGFYRRHVQMFDPGWQTVPRTVRGPEDEGTADYGNDPVGVARRLQAALAGECDSECEDQLRHTITVHFRGRYAADDARMLGYDGPVGSGKNSNMQATVYLHKLFADLAGKYVRQRRCQNGDAAIA